MNILVTGGAGFIGSNLCRYILEKYPEDVVSVLDALTYAGHLSTIEDLERKVNFHFHQGRIENPDDVKKVLRSEKVEAVINCAAETHNDRSLLEGGPFLHTNVLGVDNLLNICSRNGVSKFVHVSTDEVYGSLNEGEFTEESPLKPNTPYSASKAAGDLLCRAHFVSYGTPVCITRGGNTYGPYQFPEKLISFFLSRLIEDKKVPLYGEGMQIREWIHVMDHAAGIDTVLRKGVVGEIYNISDKNERKNADIVGFLISALGKSSDLIRKIPDPRKGAHDQRYSMSTMKLQALGWSPQVDFDSGLRDTVEWYVQHKNWWKPLIKKPEFQAFVREFYGPGLQEDL